jgi:hypothetical protein
MCPLRDVCKFYGNCDSEKLSNHEAKLMKKVFCESDLFMLNKDCKIFYLYMKNVIPGNAMLPIGKL